MPAAALRPLCVVLKAAAAWQQTDAIVASLVREDIRGREEVMPSSLQAMDRAAHHQVLDSRERALLPTAAAGAGLSHRSMTPCSAVSLLSRCGAST